MIGETKRRPGERAFTVVLFLGSLFLLWSAYGISGFEALSSPGAVPMATTFVMAVTLGIVLVKTARRPRDTAERLGREVLPPLVVVFAVLLLLYAVALEPLGFLPTSFLFLLVSIRILSKRSILHAALVALLSLALIYVLFRIVFTVLIPAGIVPEAEILSALRAAVGGWF
ncbi:tripartite tricarboxylate transporter TctB family protein [Aureimonas flava]|uniref:Tripartite tricarboxylate transporter TctB family protein n=1 Tax=Aureimonas flava TaxID=2320271 RepID=A0A3A1WN35_9HYPH|nr:tripartite tricarboxylate transporter TctB family protein [Aureimonas flava]RIX97984.1 tripartite tricarboxylate transporter TctB family protein [Aureimonas flava]